jgi:hypothetical protein
MNQTEETKEVKLRFAAPKVELSESHIDYSTKVALIFGSETHMKGWLEQEKQESYKLGKESAAIEFKQRLKAIWQEILA